MKKIVYLLMFLPLIAFADPQVSEGYGNFAHMPFNKDNADQELKFNDNDCEDSLINTNGDGTIRGSQTTCEVKTYYVPWHALGIFTNEFTLSSSDMTAQSDCKSTTSDYDAATGTINYTEYKSQQWVIKFKAKKKRENVYKIKGQLTCLAGNQ